MSRINISEVSKKFLSCHGTFSAPNGFARPLGCLLNKPKSTAALVDFDKKASRATFSYRVPHTVTYNDNMMVSAMMATFDELSTVGIILLDKSHRWGVSVNLSTTLLGEAKTGDELLMDVSFDKMGRTLSFCHMKLKNSKTGAMVAEGQHVKFMPVSWIYDNFISLPAILPLFLNLLFTFNAANEVISRTFFGKKAMPPPPEGDDLEVTTNLDNIAEGFEMREENGIFQFEAKQRMCNPMSLHGGCAAMAAETAFLLSRDRLGVDKSKRVTRMDMNYLSAINKSRSDPVNVEFDEDDLQEKNEKAATNTARGALLQKGKKNMLFELQFS